MALWFFSYTTSHFIVIVYDVSIVIVYDVSIVIVYDATLLLSLTYQFQRRLRKTDCTNLWVIKLTKYYHLVDFGLVSVTLNNQLVSVVVVNGVNFLKAFSMFLKLLQGFA